MIDLLSGITPFPSWNFPERKGPALHKGISYCVDGNITKEKDQLFTREYLTVWTGILQKKRTSSSQGNILLCGREYYKRKGPALHKGISYCADGNITKEKDQLFTREYLTVRKGILQKKRTSSSQGNILLCGREYYSYDEDFHEVRFWLGWLDFVKILLHWKPKIKRDNAEMPDLMRISCGIFGRKVKKKQLNVNNSSPPVSKAKLNKKVKKLDRQVDKQRNKTNGIRNIHTRSQTHRHPEACCEYQYKRMHSLSFIVLSCRLRSR